MQRIDKLRDLAALLEESLTDASVGVRAQLAAQYRATLAEIDSLSEDRGEKAGDPVDEVAKRRTARRGAAASSG